MKRTTNEQILIMAKRKSRIRKETIIGAIAFITITLFAAKLIIHGPF